LKYHSSDRSKLSEISGARSGSFWKPRSEARPFYLSFGAVTVVAAAMVVVLLTVTAGTACLGGAVVARHRAQAAADLAALAAAARLPAGAEAACAQATAVARAMRSTTSGCVADDLDVVVTVDVRVGARWGYARAAARAGPV